MPGSGVVPPVEVNQYSTTLDTKRIKREVEDKIYFVDPEAAPLVSMTSKLKQTSNKQNIKFEYQTFTPRNPWSATTTTGTGTTVAVTDGTQYQVGQVISCVRTKEQMRIESISTNDLTVKRGLGDTVAAALVSGDIIVGHQPVFGELADAPTATWKDTSWVYNYCERFQISVQLSKAVLKTAMYGENPLAMEHKAKVQEYLRNQERSFIQGERYKGTCTIASANGEVYVSGGARYFITTNLLSQSGAYLDSATLISQMPTIMRYGNHSRKVLYCSHQLAARIEGWALPNVRTDVNNTKWGYAISEWHTTAGTLEIVPCYLLDDMDTASTYSGDLAFIFDMNEIKKAIFTPVSLETNIQNPQSTGYRMDNYEGWHGWQFGSEKAHSILYAWT